MGIFRKMKEKRDAKKKAELEECKKNLLKFICRGYFSEEPSGTPKKKAPL